jgi:hypothetical protein
VLLPAPPLREASVMMFIGVLLVKNTDAASLRPPWLMKA